jgi:hypothetical protein
VGRPSRGTFSPVELIANGTGGGVGGRRRVEAGRTMVGGYIQAGHWEEGPR